MSIREKNGLKEALGARTPEWIDPTPRTRGAYILRNLAVASALVLCAVTLHTGAIPQFNSTADVVLTAVTDQSLLDDQLGKLSFVSSFFPEAVLVFGVSDSHLTMPVDGGVVVHAWSASEPYMSWRTSDTQVRASADGEVVGVYHGDGDERLVQVAGTEGLACLYGNLAEVFVQTGDPVSAGDILGTLAMGEDFVLEVRKDGKSVDPSLYLSR